MARRAKQASCQGDEKSEQSKGGKQHRPRLAENGLVLLAPHVGGTGPELPAKTPGNTALQPVAGAKSGAIFQLGGTPDADLAAVVSAWPALPEDVRQSILRAVESARGDVVQ